MTKKRTLIIISIIGAFFLLAAAVFIIVPRIQTRIGGSDSSDIVIATTAATISQTGFCSNITADATPADAISSGSAGTKCAYAKVDNLDRGTSVTVYMTAPDGTKSRENTLAVNTNSYLFAYYDFSQSGEYTVTWQVVGKEAVSTVFQVN